MHQLPIILVFFFGFSNSTLGFESTSVLPSGVRNFSITHVGTVFNKKKNQNGSFTPLAAPLNAALTFRDLIKGESGIKKKQIQALLINDPELTKSTELGKFEADLEATLNIVAPIFAYGFSSQLTLAVAIPYYQGKSAINTVFHPNNNSLRFINSLADQETNAVKSAREVTTNFNSAVSKLNDKLIKNNYQSLGRWQKSGLGDITLAAKYLALSRHPFKVSLTAGIVLPTGEVDDPNLLTDIPFGDGQYDIFSALTFDQKISKNVTLTEYLKYTHQAVGEKKIRWKTATEPLEVPLVFTQFNLGDSVDSMLTCVYQNPDGFIIGIGSHYFRKFSDNYSIKDPESKKEWEKYSEKKSLYSMLKLGFSTVNSYRENQFPAPLIASIEYRKQSSAINTPVTDLTYVNIKLFF